MKSCRPLGSAEWATTAGIKLELGLTIAAFITRSGGKNLDDQFWRSVKFAVGPKNGFEPGKTAPDEIGHDIIVVSKDQPRSLGRFPQIGVARRRRSRA